MPLSFNDVSKEDYVSAVIAIYELQNIQPLLDLYMFSYIRTCSMYDETVKAASFDEVRVRYRSQRRDLLRRIILGEVKEKEISLESVKKIPAGDLPLFIEDVLEDLREMDPSRIVGLGITLEQLNDWLAGKMVGK